jgi:hypothetical protein
MELNSVSRGLQDNLMLPDQAGIHRKPLGLPNPNFREGRMARVEEVVRLLRDRYA